MEPFAQLKKQMAEKLKSPTVFFDAKENDVLSGLALWRKAHDRRHQLRAEGFLKGDLYFCQKPNGFEFLVDLMACVVGQYRFFPCHSLTSEEKQQALELAKANPEISLFLATGGTVQRKVVGLTESNILHQIEVHSQILGLKSEEVRLCVLPWSHSFGFVLDLMLGLFNQQTIVIARNSSSAEVLHSIETYQVQHFACVPRHLEAVKQKLKNENLSEVQIHYGGAFLSKETRNWCDQRFRNVFEGYGLTEAGPGVLMNGQPAGCEVELRRSEFEGIFELWVRPQHMTYWKNKQICERGFFNTSDLAVPSNDVFQIVGRNSDLFKNSSGQWQNRFDFIAQLKKKIPCEYLDYNPAKNELKVVSHEVQERIRATIHKILASDVKIEILQPDLDFWNKISISRKKSLEDSLREFKAA